jgi:hypothetical protein
MEADEHGGPLHQAIERIRDFMDRFRALRLLTGVWRLAGGLAEALAGRSGWEAVCDVLIRLRSFAEGRNTLVYFDAKKDRAPLGEFCDELAAALPGPLQGPAGRRLGLLQETLAAAQATDV